MPRKPPPKPIGYIDKKLKDSLKISEEKPKFSEAQTQYSPSSLPSKGTEIKLYYTGGSGPGDFYTIFLDKESDQYPELNDELQAFYSDMNNYKGPLLDKGSPVAIYEFESWHRGRIMGEKVLLVDSGEFCDLESCCLQSLDSKFLLLPPLAKSCKLYDLLSDALTVNKEDFESLFEKITTAIYNGMNEENTHHLISPLTKEGIPFLSLLSKDNPSKAPLNAKEDSLSTWNPLKEDYENENNTLAYRSDNVDCLLNTNYAIGPDGTERPEICKFYRAKKLCPRGDKCIFLHCSLDDAEAYAGEDVAYTQMAELELPPIDSLIGVQVTSISSLTYFYILMPWGPQDIRSSSFDPNNELDSLSELNKELNQTCKKVKANSNLFFLSDIVAALHPADDKWYRARIIDMDNGEGVLNVFFVDYGEELPVARKFLRLLEPRFLHFPFQALEAGFPIADLPFSAREELQKDIWASNLLELTQNRVVLARIIQKEIDNKLTLSLFYVNENNEFVDVLNKLKEMLLA